MFVYAYEKAHSLTDFAIEKMIMDKPSPGPKDVLVRLKASSFNPVDAKVRSIKSSSNGQPVVLGWDACGVVESTGSDVQNCSSGDVVYYAGDITRAGSNSEYQLVDCRLIAQKPRSLSFSEAAALPLTALTAWEALFERGFQYTKDTKVLIIGGAGGVGSMAIQMLKAKTKATVVATASRSETRQWCKLLGADQVIDRDLDVENVDIVFSTTHTADYLDKIREILNPFGHLVLIDSPAELDISSFKNKALSVHWEYMFAKSMLNHHMETQGKILSELAELVDKGLVKSTLKKILPNSLESIREAHELLERGKSIGKIVMEW